MATAWTILLGSFVVMVPLALIAVRRERSYVGFVPWADFFLQTAVAFLLLGVAAQGLVSANAPALARVAVRGYVRRRTMKSLSKKVERFARDTISADAGDVVEAQELVDEVRGIIAVLDTEDPEDASGLRAHTLRQLDRTKALVNRALANALETHDVVAQLRARVEEVRSDTAELIDLLEADLTDALAAMGSDEKAHNRTRSVTLRLLQGDKPPHPLVMEHDSYYY